MEQIYFSEIFEYPIKEFKNHLEQDLNERIIFSGKYGIGKTKFLQEFFSGDNQKSLFKSIKYNVYRLFPTNYSIASNEDIIRYIKYDIIIEMLKNSITLEETKLKLIDTLPDYVIKNFDKVTASLVYMIPKVGKEIVDCFEKIEKLKDEYLKFHDNTNVSSGDRLLEYLENIEIKEGSIYESDIVTKIISETLKKEDDSESILLIDDVDRLDPEHVFRILNVFASHFDGSNSSQKNKFNFDKIIIVCDFNNIRNIFHHRYGTEVDFMGYIDKFYSTDVYYFDNKKAIIKTLDKIFDSINTKLGTDTAKGLRQIYFQNDFLSSIISVLVTRGYLSLRNIIKFHGKNFKYHSESLQFDKNLIVQSWRIPITAQLKFLKDLLGDYQNMKRIFNQPSLHKESPNDYGQYFGELIYFLSNKIHNFQPHVDYLYTFNSIDIVVEASIGFRHDRFEYAHLYDYTNKMLNNQGIPQRGNHLYVSSKMFWDALNDTIDKLHRIGYLN